MTDQLPEFSESMEYDELAYKNLRTYFTLGKFAISEVRTVLGSREFGKDFIIEQLNKKRKNTGIEFLVQSKTTKAIEKDGHITIQINVANINYLAAKTSPVFIHVYQRKQRRGYWLWFQEWYIANHSPKWRNDQTTVTLRVPTTQKLTRAAVSEIMQLVTEESFKTRVRQAAELFNRLNPDYRTSSPEFLENNIFTVMHPKKDGIQHTFAVDEAIHKAIQKADEEGYAIRFPLMENDFPDPFASLRAGDGQLFLTLVPEIPLQFIRLGFHFYSGDETLINEYNSVDLRLIRPGSVEREFRGNPQDVPIVFALTIRPKQGSELIEGTLDLLYIGSSDPIIAKQYLELRSKLSLASKVVITSSSTGLRIAETSIKWMSPVSDNLKRFIDAAVNLKQQHNIHVPVPMEVPDETLCGIELSNDILTSGKSNWVINPNPTGWITILKEARKLIEFFSRKGYMLIAKRPDDIKIEVMGTTVDLGTVNSVFYVTRIINFDDIQRILSDESITDDSEIVLELDIDTAKSFTVAVKT